MLARIKQQWNSGRTVGQIVLAELGRFLGGLLPKDPTIVPADHHSPLGAMVDTVPSLNAGSPGDRAAAISEIGLVGDGHGYQLVIEQLPAALDPKDNPEQEQWTVHPNMPSVLAPNVLNLPDVQIPSTAPSFSEWTAQSDKFLFKALGLTTERQRAINQTLGEFGRKIHLQLSYEHADDYLTRCVIEQRPADSSRLDLFVAGSFPDETHSKRIDDYITNVNKT